MDTIWVFGHSPSNIKSEFENESKMIEWMKKELFDDDHGRYRTTQKRDAKIIVVSFEGKILGYFNVLEREAPNQDDRKRYLKTKWVYIISRSNVFEIKNRLSDFGVSGVLYGKQIEENVFENIRAKGGNIQTFPAGT